MTMNDTLANAMSKIQNAERAGKKTCTVRSSSVIKKVLGIMNSNRYVGVVTEVKTRRGIFQEVSLIGGINKCGAIKPRFAVAKNEIEKYEQRYLPAKDFGFIILSTSKGLMTHPEVKSHGLGGRLIAYCY